MRSARWSSDSGPRMVRPCVRRRDPRPRAPERMSSSARFGGEARTAIVNAIPAPAGHGRGESGCGTSSCRGRTDGTGKVSRPPEAQRPASGPPRCQRLCQAKDDDIPGRPCPPASPRLGTGVRELALGVHRLAFGARAPRRIRCQQEVQRVVFRRRQASSSSTVQAACCNQRSRADRGMAPAWSVARNGPWGQAEAGRPCGQGRPRRAGGRFQEPPGGALLVRARAASRHCIRVRPHRRGRCPGTFGTPRGGRILRPAGRA